MAQRRPGKKKRLRSEGPAKKNDFAAKARLKKNDFAAKARLKKNDFAAKARLKSSQSTRIGPDHCSSMRWHKRWPIDDGQLR